jgi:hypothetical protein
VVLAHVQQNRLGILFQPFARLFNGDFADARFGVFHQFEKTGRMFHARKLVAVGHGQTNFIFRRLTK